MTSFEKAEQEMPVLKTGISENVLLIEDDRDTLEILGQTLIQEGFGVRCTSTREEALNVIEKYIYDIIVMDYSMPGISAENFMNEVRRRVPRSKFILMTAMNLVEKRASGLGINFWIGKPFDPDTLLKTIRTVASLK